MADEICLNYHNSLLRKSDVDLLQEGKWLNDKVIGFWFEYLEHDIYTDDNSVCLIGPEVSQFIKLGSPEESVLFTEPLNLRDKLFILLPINDSVSFDSPGGSHWSLLVYSKPEDRYYHFDSMGGSNSDHAKRAARNMQISNGRVIETKCAQQHNSYDCGVYVCCFTEHILRHCTAEKKPLSSLPVLVPDARNHRKKMAELISTLSTK